jgi:integrase
MPDNRVTVWVQHFKDRPHLVLQWFDPDTGKRKSKSAQTADPEEAEVAREKLQYELRHGKYQEASKLSWKGFRELFEAEYLPNCRPKTRAKIRSVLDIFEEHCNPRQLQAINERVLSLFVTALRKRKGRGNPTMVPYTIKVHLAYLHITLAWAFEQKLLTVCPDFPKIKVPKKKPQPVPPESFECLLAKAPDQQMCAYLLCGWLAGLRLGEAFALEWEETDQAPWVDFARNRIWLPATFTKAVEDQWVPLDPQLRQALESLPRTGRKVFRFVAATDGHVLQDNAAICQRVRKLARQAGVRLTMKSLRKGFGCYYAARVSAHVLQKLMRHADIKTTMDYYANVDAAVEQAVLARPHCNAECNNALPSSASGSGNQNATCHINGS